MKKTIKRELVAPARAKRFVRRDASGRFKHVVDVGASLARDVRTKAERKVPAGQGDRGDQAR